jgi:hypothetical protein
MYCSVNVLEVSVNLTRRKCYSNRTCLECQVKVKESRNRPGVVQRVPGGLVSQISWHSARKNGEVVSLTHRPPLPPGMFLLLILTRGWIDPRTMVWSEGNMSLKNPVTPPGIDPGTVRKVAQRIKHYATPGSLEFQVPEQNVNETLWPSGIFSVQCMSIIDYNIRGRGAEYYVNTYCRG